MKLDHISDFGAHFVSCIHREAQQAVDRDLCGRTVSDHEYEDLVAAKIISMIEHVIAQAARLCK